MSVALILAGHGSHISPNTAGVVWDYVDALRARGVADEITATFWKEQPEFSDVLNSIASDTVVIVPVFTASGYFSKQVIPAEMGLICQSTERDGKTFHYTRTLGEHPAIPQIVRQRVIDALTEANLPQDDTSVAIIGHGTKRSETTRKTTRHQVELIREAHLVADVLDAYLDDDPDIPSIYERTSSKNIIAVPFFLAEGSHATQDVPEALGIRYGDYPAQIEGHDVYYTPPIGSNDDVVDLILQLARETGLPFTEKESDTWQQFPQNGFDTLIETVETGDIQFGELIINKTHIQPVNTTSEHILRTVPVMREHVRNNPFRPLASSADLRRDWCVPVESAEQIPAIIETIYPGAIADWAAQQQGTFEVQSLETVLARQQGMFRDLAQIDAAIIHHHVSSICGRCTKHPTWLDNRAISTKIPCPSPCNLCLSTLKEDIKDDG